MAIESIENRQRAERLAEVLDDLKAKGFTQAQVARELNIPANYLSDLRNNQRVITEPLARTIASVCGVSFEWLWLGTGNQDAPKMHALDIQIGAGVMLPVLNAPHVGDPRATAAWDGSLLNLTGRAAAKAAGAVMPYVLRMATGDKSGRLEPGDLILISQECAADEGFALICSGDHLLLAKRYGQTWKSVETGRRISDKSEVVGRAMGIVWGTL